MWQIRLFTDFTDFSTFWSNFRAFCSPNQNILKSVPKSPKFVQFVTNLTNFVANLVTLSHLGPIWPTLEPNLPSLTLSHIQTCVLRHNQSCVLRHTFLRVCYVTGVLTSLRQLPCSIVCMDCTLCKMSTISHGYYKTFPTMRRADYASCLTEYYIVCRLCDVPTMRCADYARHPSGRSCMSKAWGMPAMYQSDDEFLVGISDAWSV